MTFTAWLQRDGFFGPCFHSYEDCPDGPGEPVEVQLPDSAFPLPGEWVCFKCGDFLDGSLIEGEEVSFRPS